MKTLDKISILAAVIALFVICTSCSSESKVVEEEVVCIEKEPTFKLDVLPIFESNCMNCHNEEDYARKADGNLMASYEDIKAKLDEGLIIGNIEHKPGFINMPYRKKKITDCEIEIIKAWVKAGAKNN